MGLNHFKLVKIHDFQCFLCNNVESGVGEKIENFDPRGWGLLASCDPDPTTPPPLSIMGILGSMFPEGSQSP